MLRLVPVPGPLLVVLGLRDRDGSGVRGGGRDRAVVLGDPGLRVPEVEVAGVAVDEALPGLGQRRIWRRVAGSRRRHFLSHNP